jgi:hypothetical protein
MFRAKAAFLAFFLALTWKKFTWIFAGIAALAVAVPTMLSLSPSAADLKRALVLLPAAVLLAALRFWYPCQMMWLVSGRVWRICWFHPSQK